MAEKPAVKPRIKADTCQFLVDYPGMVIVPSRSLETILKGIFSFSANYKNAFSINDSYELEIIIPATFPKSVPKVTETGGGIPRNGRYHVNPDGTLCLGSPLRLMQIISKKPTIVGFAEKCLVPFLYAVSYKLQNGGDFIFSELAHGDQGIINDYLDLFQLTQQNQVIVALKKLGMKRRIANKRPCPCGCGKRLGKCKFNHKLNPFRKMAPRAWFKAQVRKV